MTRCAAHVEPLVNIVYILKPVCIYQPVNMVSIIRSERVRGEYRFLCVVGSEEKWLSIYISCKRLKHEAKRPMFPYPSPVEYKRRALELNSELVVEQAKNAALGSHVDQLKNELAVAKRQAALVKNRLDIALEHIEHQKLFISDYCSVAFSSIYSEQ